MADPDTEDNGVDQDHEESTLSDGEEEQFDITLPATHSYLSGGLIRVPARSVLEGGWCGQVPCVAHHGAVFPGETVPMLFTHPHDMATLTNAIRTDGLFGLLCPNATGAMLSGYGVLCEVFEAVLPDSEEYRLNNGEPATRSLTFKARANHRFKLVEMPSSPQPLHSFIRVRPVMVCVLPEVRLRDPLWHSRLASLDSCRKDKRLRSINAVVTPWPLFIYEIFDYQRTSEVIRKYFKTLMFDKLPQDMVSLSFWVASNLSLSPRDRLALFVVDNALLRLHMEVHHINKKSVLCCASCAAEVARREHIFAMSSEGLHSNYCNLGGYVHDVMTVSRVSNTTVTGMPSEEFSWFPGYTWTIALCTSCMAHVGWRFDATKRSLRPQRFWGLCRNYVVPRGDLQSPSEDEQAQDEPRPEI